MKIEIKDKKVLSALMNRLYHPILIDIVSDVADKFGIVITEAYRDQKHPNDLHGTYPVRAIDLRSWIYELPEIVENYINNKWIYDPKRSAMKVAILHDSGQGVHFHIQVYPNTCKRKGAENETKTG